mgnify:CR=1 FL=1
MQEHRTEFRVIPMCRVLGVHRSGFYAWLRHPESARTQEDRRLLEAIRHSHEENDDAYGSPRVHKDLRGWGYTCGRHRVARLMRQNSLMGVPVRRKPRFVTGRPSVVAPNRLQQDFTVEHPDRVWVTDFTYIRTHEGWLYLAAIMDLYSRRIVGWATGPRITSELALDALMMAVWRRKPAPGLVLHSDQGSQFGSYDWQSFLRDHGIVPSMSRRGNCYDNAAKESFFSSLKRERIRRKTYRTREEARADIFDYIEMFYNPKRRHSYLGQISPIEYELAHGGT